MSFAIHLKNMAPNSNIQYDIISMFKSKLRKNENDVYIGDKLFKTYSILFVGDEIHVHLDPMYEYCIDQYKNFGLNICGKKYKVTRI